MSQNTTTDTEVLAFNEAAEGASVQDQITRQTHMLKQAVKVGKETVKKKLNTEIRVLEREVSRLKALRAEHEKKFAPAAENIAKRAIKGVKDLKPLFELLKRTGNVYDGDKPLTLLGESPYVFLRDMPAWSSAGISLWAIMGSLDEEEDVPGTLNTLVRTELEWRDESICVPAPVALREEEVALIKAFRAVSREMDGVLKEISKRERQLADLPNTIKELEATVARRSLESSDVGRRMLKIVDQAITAHLEGDKTLLLP